MRHSGVLNSTIAAPTLAAALRHPAVPDRQTCVHHKGSTGVPCSLCTAILVSVSPLSTIVLLDSARGPPSVVVLGNTIRRLREVMWRCR